MIARLIYLCLAVTMIPSGWCQEALPYRDAIPFRRVFVPSRDLEQLGLEGYSSVNVQSLEELLEQVSKERSQNIKNSKDLDTDLPHLSSAFYVAKLNGADLLSEGSQLTLTGTSMSGEGVTLQPWSLAIATEGSVQPLGLNLSESDKPNGLTPWVFDSLGNPRVPISSKKEKFGSLDGSVRSPQSHLFGWSARSESDSTPNKLNFVLAIPKCANSCLVLSLPPQSLISECTNVVTRTNKLSDIATRLGGWQAWEKESQLSRDFNRGTESLWLIELGGCQSLSFTVMLGTGVRTQENVPATEFPKTKLLIKSQRLEHFVESQDIRTTCEAEVFVSSKFNQPMRLKLSEGAKLSRFQVNDKEVDWQWQDGWIQWGFKPEEQAGAPATATMRLAIELRTPLATDLIAKLETPRVSLDMGYVMTGSSIVNIGAPWLLRAAECVNGRIVESSREANGVVSTRATEASVSKLSRLEYSWWEQPPSLAIGIEQLHPTRRCELFTRLTNDETGLEGVVRAKFYFAENDPNRIKIATAPGWIVRSATSSDRAAPIEVSPEQALLGATNEIQLSWEGLQKNRVGEVEFRLSLPVEASNPRIEVPIPISILQLPEWKRIDTFAIDLSGPFVFQPRDAILSHLIAEESIPDWQRSYLAQANKGLLLRSDSQHFRGTIPPLVWERKPSRHVANIQTDVMRLDAKAIGVKHRIKLELGSNRGDLLTVSLPSNNLSWRWLNGKQWERLKPSRTLSTMPESPQGDWIVDIRSMPTQCTIEVFETVKLDRETEVELRVPKIRNGETGSMKLRCSDKNLSIQADGEHAPWGIDEAGFQVLNLKASESFASFQVSLPVPIAQKRWSPLDSELHIAVDAQGDQKASLLIRSEFAGEGPMVVELENGWEPSAATIRHRDPNQTVSFRMDGSRLILELQPVSSKAILVSEPLDLEIELVGPRLATQAWKAGVAIANQSLVFRWPEFVADSLWLQRRNYLWLPKELALQDVDGQLSRESRTNRWPIWNWSREVVLSIFRSVPATGGTAQSDLSGAIGRIVPGWLSSDWHMALGPEISFAPSGAFGARENVSRCRIGMRGAECPYVAALFAIAALVTPRLIMWGRRKAVGFAFVLIVLSHFTNGQISHYSQAGLIGMCIGFCIWGLSRLATKFRNTDETPSQKDSARWSPWNERRERTGSESRPITSLPTRKADAALPRAATNILGFVFYISLGIGCFSEGQPLAPSAHGQDMGTDASTVYSIAIPMDDSGEMVGTNVYVPDALMRILSGKPRPQSLGERGTRPSSVKYSLRLGARSRFFSVSDQIVMNFEFIVGENLDPIRIPFNSEQLRLSRFIVDGNELAPGNRLMRDGLEWTPERPGKKTVQIIAQPTMKTTVLDRNQGLVQQMEINVLPVANAWVEIETDPSQSFDILALGRVTNPTSGKYIAMLGAVDRIKCSLQSANKSGPLATPSTPADGGESLVMNTELYLQHDVLQAKTILDFPKGVPLGKEIEIEADVQWYPIGTQWGDAHWIETRPGSTLSRRRYILEWNKAEPSVAPSNPSVKERQISVIWVPQVTNQSLNVLFAECRDRRTRLGTLRFARVPESNWSIDGISTWIPAIDSKERLDWAELKTNPLVTALRIPANGGFGVLKRKTVTERQQARITTKWTIEEFRESILSRVELLGGNANSEPLVVEIPRDFIVAEVYNRNGQIRFLQHDTPGSGQVQVLSDRKTLELSGLWIEAKRDRNRFAEQSLDRSEAFPWIGLANGISSEQTMEVSASELVALHLDYASVVVVGKGVGVPILNLARSSQEIQSNTLASSRYLKIVRNKPLQGSLRWGTAKSDGGIHGIAMVGTFSHSVASSPYFVLEVPVALKERWQTDLRMEFLACPETNKAWVQVFLPQTLAIQETSDSFTLFFVPESEAHGYQTEWANATRALDNDTIVTVLSEPSSGNQAEFAGIATPRDSKPPIARVATCLYRVLDSRPMQPNTSGSSGGVEVVLATSVWMEDTGDLQGPSETLEWQVKDEVEVLSMAVDGEWVSFQREGQVLKCLLSRAGLCSEIQIFTKHSFLENEPRLLHAPSLRDFNASSSLFVSDDTNHTLSVAGHELASSSAEVSNALLAKKFLGVFVRSVEGRPNPSRVENGSLWDRWQNHWHRQSYRYLSAWTQTATAEEQSSLSEGVRQWHALRNSMRNEGTPVKSSYRLPPPFHQDLAASTPMVKVEWSWWALSLAGCLLTLLSLAVVVGTWGAALEHRPWWYLLVLGAFVWMFSGSLLPALVLSLFGLVVLLDSYWLTIERLRRSGTHGQRSL